MAIALEAEGLTKSFHGARAVHNLSLHVRKGEIYGFLGPNGAGKTTTIRMLLGLARPEAGHARIRGIDPHADPARARLGVGYLPETLSLYPTLTARQTLRFFADLRGVPRERVDDMLALAGLQEEADHRVSEFSRGMSQRLGLAQALLGEPDILILDEPTSALDPHALRHIKELLRERARHGVTLLVSSHQLADVQDIAHRVGIVQKGRLLAEDTMESLRARLGMQGVLVLKLERPEMVDLEAVCAIDGVQRAWLDGARLAVVCRSDLRFDLARAVHERGAFVTSMETREPSLEDVFFRLTEAADEPQGGPTP